MESSADPDAPLPRHDHGPKTDSEDVAGTLVFEEARKVTLTVGEQLAAMQRAFEEMGPAISAGLEAGAEHVDGALSDFRHAMSGISDRLVVLRSTFAALEELVVKTAA